ncbi:hypothetical protein B0P06_003592 [Clostridium saccharoperbutylacetonicum]|uniref:Tyrosine specific protein phosphatases domain-containing protein n=2 Tax=Clostridium saccharoperbutylacetonicum TaxID=36745 RepID=M1MTR4_9CLOT|nr:GxGYxYP domain-containing protein [Clostridium saccharoperbutylacetonicum]AGF58096.1 putative protein-tyrosine phosphatase [Clostridium saccharoperbutylacetonicum N1-4(HMT)]NRT61130.1 hypothetical protein [Clostridium saccharoperbutylacetonicum]NSB24445.1 hypothetical protein [Clostridium saccharoperbutylacetonicum]NSB43821.1 hypothetical protein [Clostridium saccharoperbutylacetonicum]
MYRKLKLLVILVMFMTTISSFMVKKNVEAQSVEENIAHLVLDTSTEGETIPKEFRKTSDLTSIKDNKNINLKGLDKLNISGSQQFSEFNLPTLIKSIGTSMPITDIDLRQESHGFINGLPVSWANSKNNANEGLTREQVLEDEASKLKSIKIGAPITFDNKPKETVIVAKVEDEKDIVKSNSVSYKRIPIRDGGIPSDEMVDYFIDFVKNQGDNSWLHFHCKAGVGRTTTFMIMYDMTKNCKEIGIEDIINRHMALAAFNEENIKSFQNKERMDFLKKFYDYCKENANSFNKKWSEWKTISTTDNGVMFQAFKVPRINSPYIRNKIIPNFLYVISLDSMSSSERTMVASLQGLVNNHCSFQIYTLTSSEPDYKIWLNDLKKNNNIQCKIISDPWQLVEIYKDYIDGYVLYSNKSPKDPSINNACTFASLNKAIVIEESIEAKVKKMGIGFKEDCRNTGESWAYDNLWNKGLNHLTVIELSPDKDAALRDYAIMSKSLIFYEDSINKTVLRDKVFSSMDKGFTCLGWGPDEFINVSVASKHGVSVVAADWAYNLTTLSSFPTSRSLKKYPLGTPKEEDVHYVTFIMSDGDNLQWNLGNNYSSTKWFGNTNRDKLSLGWSMTPALYYLAPTVFNIYYKSISNEKTYNNFIVPPSGNGYMYPSKFDIKKLSEYINTLNEYMKIVDEKYLEVIDDYAFYNTEIWNRFTEKSNIQGLFYLDYTRHDNFGGKIIWSNNKPIVSCRDLLWNSIEDEDELVNKINARVKSGETNIHTSEAYTFVYIHVWSKDLNNVETVINKLKENPKVRITTPEVFMELIRNNITPQIVN